MQQMLDRISTIPFPKLDRTAGQKSQDIWRNPSIFNNHPLRLLSSGRERSWILYWSQRDNSGVWRWGCDLGQPDSWTGSHLFIFTKHFFDFFFQETTRYTIESLVHRKSVWTDASDAGHKVLIFYNPFFEYSSKDDELRYNIEPFFWSSSLNWITSRFQEEIKKKVGDRESDLWSEVLDYLDYIFDRSLVDITITLTFLHSLSNHEAVQLATNLLTDDASTMLGSQSIDTQAPLILYSSLSPRSIPSIFHSETHF